VLGARGQSLGQEIWTVHPGTAYVPATVPDIGSGQPKSPVRPALERSLEERLAEGQQLRAAGRYREAEDVLTRLLPDARRGRSGGVFVAAVLDSLGITEQDLANYVEAERLFTDALAQLRQAGQKEGDTVAQMKAHLGETYLEESRYREATTVLRQSLEMLQGDPRSDPETVAVTMLDLALTRAQTHSLQEAEVLMRQALGLLEARRGPDHPILASALIPLAGVLTRAGRYDEALDLAERAWRILRGNPAVGEPDRLNAIGALGTLYSLAGRYREAEQYSKDAVGRSEAIYGPDHPRVGHYLRTYADVLKREGRKAEAKTVEKRADAILNKANPAGHTVNVTALR
jgi:tetratricopeptide (TPR) repeat protein